MTLGSRRVLAPAAILFGIMVAHALLETARDALFIAELGPDRLAWAYLAIAAAALVAVTAVRTLGKPRDPRAMTIGFLVAAAAGTMAIAVTVTLAPSVVFILYVWTGLVATLVVPSFWTMIDRSWRIVEAKKAFATIGAGGILGAMVGSGLAAILGRVLPAHTLVLLGAIGFSVVTLVAIAIAPRPLDERPPRHPPADAEPRRAYVRWMILLGLLSTVALTLGDLTFKHVLADQVAPENLPTAFGAIYAGLNVIALVIQLMLTPRVLSRLGVGGAAIVLPLVLAATAMGFALTGAVIAMIALKLGDGGLRHSLHRVVSEILYVPLPSAIRDRTKPIADAIGHRGGQALAALLVFALVALGADVRTFAFVTGAIAVVWLGAVLLVRTSYVHQFRDTLRAGEIQRNIQLPDLDATSIEVLTESLSSPDEAEALAAIDLLARTNRVPALVLYHPSETVVRRALALIARRPRPEIARVLEYLMDSADPQIRAAALATAARIDCHLDRVVAALDSTDSDVRAAALVACATHPDHAETSTRGIVELLGGTASDRLALARAIALMPNARFRVALDELLSRREPAVMRQALRVLARAPELANLERLLGLLADPHIRNDVRRVLIATGPRGRERLIGALDDPRTPLGVRRHIPRTISRFRSRTAAAALTARLLREPDGTTEFKILRALGRMRSDDPTLPIDVAAIREYARRSLGDAARYATLADQLGPSPTHSGELLRELLDEKRFFAVEHVFRALDILEPTAGLRSAHDAISSRDPDRRAAALEILEHVVRADLRYPLLAVIESLDPEERRSRLGELAAPLFGSERELFVALLADRSESLRCVVAHHIAERKLSVLRAELARLQTLDDPPFVTDAFEQAIARLDG
jgi:AAA family ATP:ADP antiporter